MRERRDHLRIVSSNWPAPEPRQAEPMEIVFMPTPEPARRPSIGHLILSSLAWIGESNWRAAAFLGGAILLGMIGELILP